MQARKDNRNTRRSIITIRADAYVSTHEKAIGEGPFAEKIDLRSPSSVISPYLSELRVEATRTPQILHVWCFPVCYLQRISSDVDRTALPGYPRPQLFAGTHMQDLRDQGLQAVEATR